MFHGANIGNSFCYIAAQHFYFFYFRGLIGDLLGEKCLLIKFNHISDFRSGMISID